MLAVLPDLWFQKNAPFEDQRGWGTKLKHSWGFALREGVFAETKEGKCKTKGKKASFKEFKKSASLTSDD